LLAVVHADLPDYYEQRMKKQQVHADLQRQVRALEQEKEEEDVADDDERRAALESQIAKPEADVEEAEQAFEAARTSRGSRSPGGSHPRRSTSILDKWRGRRVRTLPPPHHAGQAGRPHADLLAMPPHP